MTEKSTIPDLVELNRRAIESAARRDFDEAMSSYGPDSVWDMSPAGLGTFHGVAAIRGMIEDWMSAFATSEYEVEIEEIRQLGNGVTIAVVRQGGQPVGSSGRVQLDYASVTEWADGVVARVTHYTDIDQARAAAERLAEERG
jgi:ketosteroid isomerase-like protein